MADINVERKGRRVWPWVVGLIVLALLIWALIEMFGRNRPEVVDEEPVATSLLTAPHERDGH